MTTEKHYFYILRPLVQAPWGEMEVSITLPAPDWWTCRKKALAELERWKESQKLMGRNDFPWLDQAITYVEKMTSPSFFFGWRNETNDVHINWYDEREPVPAPTRQGHRPDGWTQEIPTVPGDYWYYTAIHRQYKLKPSLVRARWENGNEDQPLSFSSPGGLMCLSESDWWRPAYIPAPPQESENVP